MTDRTHSRGGLHVHGSEHTGICDYCGRTVLAGELRWVVEDWELAHPSPLDRTMHRRGHETATLCPDCQPLAVVHCWHCGELTGREDDLCERCRRDGVA